jgi:predicted GIY-YIG superfamily endonuclease
LRCADRTLYTGVAKDVRARVAAHNAGRGAKYTRTRLPVKIVYEEQVPDRGAALRREHAIKRLPRLAKLALLKRPSRAAQR